MGLLGDAELDARVGLAALPPRPRQRLAKIVGAATPFQDRAKHLMRLDIGRLALDHMVDTGGRGIGLAQPVERRGKMEEAGDMVGIER